MNKRKKKKRNWSQAELDQLVELRKQIPPLPVKEIASRIGRSYHGTNCKLIDLRLRVMRVWTQADDERIVAMARGKPRPTLDEMGKVFGVTGRTIQKRLSRMGINVARVWTARELKQAILWRKEKPILPIAEIARRLNRPKYSVQYKLFTLGVIEHRQERGKRNRAAVLTLLRDRVKRTDADIAELLDLSRAYVSDIRNSYGIPPAYSPGERMAIAAKYKHAYRKARSDPKYIEEAQRSEDYYTNRTMRNPRRHARESVRQ